MQLKRTAGIALPAAVLLYIHVGQVENTESGNGNGNGNGNSEKIVRSKSVYGRTRYSYQVLSTEYIEVRCKFVGDE